MAVTRTDPIINYLAVGNWNEVGGGGPHHYNVVPGGTLTADISALNNAEQQFARAALAVWTEASGINFSISTTHLASAKITFDNTQSGAYTSSSWNGSGITTHSTVNIQTSWIYGDTTIGNRGAGNAVYDSYSMQTYVHEIGHALGLGHPGNYNGTATYPVDALYANDSWQSTIMSYFSQSENYTTVGYDGVTGASYVYILTPQLADVQAIHSIYGLPNNAHTGNTTYGVNSNAGDVLDKVVGFSSPVSFTITDSSGVDTINFSNYNANQNIVLREGAISDVQGGIGNMMIAFDTIIENATSGGGNDILLGNTGKNMLHGGGGADVLVGGLARDHLFGDAGNDELRGGRGNDVLKGGGGNDILRGGLGIDVMTGGTGADTFIFRRTVDFSQAAGSSDSITDFSHGLDSIKLNGDGFAYGVGNIAISSTVAGTYDVAVDTSHIVHVTMTSGILDATDFVFV